MYFEREADVFLKKKQQKKYSKAYQMHGGLLFHYATCETLWKILEGDCFWARNIRFSNDSKEYRTGQNTIEWFIENNLELSKREKKDILSHIRENPMMYYMICFCESGDLLSQWRGYAKNGVSIGLDFTGGSNNKEKLADHVEFFSVLNNQKYQDSLKDTGERKKYYIEDKSLSFLQMPYKVQYIQPGNRISEKKMGGVLNEIWQNGRTEERVGRLLHYIPFVKDKGFKEEAESRLIFDMEFLGESEAHSCKVRSKKIDYLDSDSMKKPFIRIEFGTAEAKLEEVQEVCFGKGVENLLHVLPTADKSRFNVNLRIDNEREGIYVGVGKNQEEIVEWIEKYIEVWKVPQKQKERIKIWCEGHLPIRKVIIGPSEKQTDMKESLEHYKNTVYWLRYIDVEASKIPLKD